MKKKMGWIGLTIVLSVLCTMWDKATFGFNDYNESTSLWRDHVEIVQIENAGLELVQMKTESSNGSISHSERYNLNDHDSVGITRGIAIGLFITAALIMLFIGKWAFLSLMLTEYEKFQNVMREHYYKSLIEWENNQYHDCKASKFIFNFRVWHIDQALNRTLDTFSHHDFKLWVEDNEYRPKLKG